MTDERIRFGGVMTPEGFLFELTGGNVALDLTNTVVGRASAEPEDHLTTYRDLARFAQQTGLIDTAHMNRLLREAAAHPVAALRVVRRAAELRELLFEIFSSPEVGESALRKLAALSQEAARHRQLWSDGEVVRWTWDDDALDHMLWPIVDAAVELLTSETRPRVRTCGGITCRWLFIDNSRQGNRRWCDMTTCGNRAKAKRHYEKMKEQQ